MRTRIAGGLFPATLCVPGRVTTLKKGEDPLAGGLLVFRDYNEGTPCHIIAEPWCSTNITMVEHRGIDESRRFADSKPSVSIPRADASLRSDQNSPLDCFALSGSDPLKHHQEK